MSGMWGILEKSAEAWTQFPLQFFVAIAAGAVIGYLLSRLKHQGTIDAQKAHIGVKDEVIKFKDEAIKSASTTSKEPALQKGRVEDPRFREINAQIITDLNSKIRETVGKHRFKMVFNPTSGLSKQVTFKPNGEIGEGRNDNENSWRAVDGRLEVLNGQGQVYSRFFLLPSGKAFHHTNDPDTISIKGQYLVPENGALFAA